jgi:hypothetical protein
VYQVLTTHPWSKLSRKQYCGLSTGQRAEEEKEWTKSMVQGRVRELRQKGHDHAPPPADYEDKRVLQAMRDDGIFVRICTFGRGCWHETSGCRHLHEDDCVGRRLSRLHQQVVEYICGKEPPRDAGRAARDAWCRSFVALAEEFLRKRRQERAQATKERLGSERAGMT